MQFVIQSPFWQYLGLISITNFKGARRHFCGMYLRQKIRENRAGSHSENTFSDSRKEILAGLRFTKGQSIHEFAGNGSIEYPEEYRP
jgi:hypothetical protein